MIIAAFLYKNLEFMISYRDYHFGTRLKAVLFNKHLTVTWLSKRMGVTHGSLFNTIKKKSADLERVKQISMILQHDFVAEIAASGNNYKDNEALQAALKDKDVEIADFQKVIAEQNILIEKLSLEVKYLKEVLVAYKR